mmetsp:Transcript_15343/g.24544  ORF Transcript_15343/g.24544 Transcript_15343/m.24544 type:complete len:113 (-) Transcript_15343:332-670(-)
MVGKGGGGSWAGNSHEWGTRIPREEDEDNMTMIHLSCRDSQLQISKALLFVEEERVALLSRLSPGVFQGQRLFIHGALLVVSDHFEEVLSPVRLNGAREGERGGGVDREQII